MKDIMLLSSESIKDIVPIFAGEEKCSPEHSFGPYVREHFIIHFVISGCGTLLDKYGEHKISAGELFIIRAGESTVYTADKSAHWHYTWLAFTGDCAQKFNTGSSVYKAPALLIRKLYDLIEEKESCPFAYTAILYELMVWLFEKPSLGDMNIAEQIKAYIDYNYMDNLSVDALTRKFGFERSYLYRIFKRSFSTGIKEYITSVRMEQASKFLKSGYNVHETAGMVGYKDGFNFSKAFKSYYGYPPADLKQKSSLQNPLI
jgi:AraC-like DNA-binding protein